MSELEYFMSIKQLAPIVGTDAAQLRFNLEKLGVPVVDGAFDLRTLYKRQQQMTVIWTAVSTFETVKNLSFKD